MSEFVTLWCATCRTERDFEHPAAYAASEPVEPAELACVECGDAIFGFVALTSLRGAPRTGKNARVA